MSLTYSQAVLDGLAKSRPHITDVSSAAQIPVSRMSAVMRGDDEFTDDEVGRIEDVADLTGLQLALAATERPGAPLDEVAEAWSRVREAEKQLRHVTATDHSIAATA
jgi:hypothetical protein